MNYRLISLPILQLARLVGLVRTIEPVELSAPTREPWVLLIRGRGFTRILADEIPQPGHVYRPDSAFDPRPLAFSSHNDATAFGQRNGLLPRRRTWEIKALSP